MTEPVRALVVDDSATARAVLTGILSTDRRVQVVGEARNGDEAIEKVLALRPSVVVMDIEMPGTDGLAATERIMQEVPTPIVIVTSHHDPANVALTLNATRLGALAVLPKPTGPAAAGFEREAARLVSMTVALADVKVVRRRRYGPPASGGPLRSSGRVRVVGVGASTGGPAALYRFLEALPADLAVPVLVVQHIAEGFVDGLTRWLGAATPLEVRVPVDREPLIGGRVYVAPDGAHLEAAEGGRAHLDHGSAIGGFRPSATKLFGSLARVYGSDTAVVVLTGMGTDGLAGAQAVHAAGGRVFAQDETTSTVFGMPRAVADAGIAHVVGPVEKLALSVAAEVPMG